MPHSMMDADRIYRAARRLAADALGQQPEPDPSPTVDEARERAGFSAERWVAHVATLDLVARASRADLGLRSDGTDRHVDLEAAAAGDYGDRLALGYRTFLRHLAAVAIPGDDVYQLASGLYDALAPDTYGTDVTYLDYVGILVGDQGQQRRAPIEALSRCAALIRDGMPYRAAANATGLTIYQAKELSAFMGMRHRRAEVAWPGKDELCAQGVAERWSGAELARRWNARAERLGLRTISARTGQTWMREATA